MCHRRDILQKEENSNIILFSSGHPSEFYRSQLGSFGVSGDLALRPVWKLIWWTEESRCFLPNEYDEVSYYREPSTCFRRF